MPATPTIRRRFASSSAVIAQAEMTTIITTEIAVMVSVRSMPSLLPKAVKPITHCSAAVDAVIAAANIPFTELLIRGLFRE